MKKIIHIFLDEKIVPNIVEMLEMTECDQEFWIFSSNNFTDRSKLLSEKNKNVYLINFSVKKDRISLSKSLKNSSLIVHHGTFWGGRVMFFWLNNILMLSKSIWFIWGGDLYGLYSKTKLNLLKKFLLKKIPTVATPIVGDYMLAQQLVKTKFRYFDLRYMDTSVFSLVEKNNENAEKKSIKVLVGNSGTTTNKHFEIIDIISKFDNENVEFYFPLSYGNKEYINKVIKYGKHKLPNTFVPITEFMPLEEYNQFLSSIDIGIFNNNRQQAVGNINALLFSKTKIYLRDDTTMWSFFKRSIKNYNVFSIFDIETMNFREFIEIDIKSIEECSAWVYKLNNSEKVCSEWEKMIYELGGKNDSRKYLGNKSL